LERLARQRQTTHHRRDPFEPPEPRDRIEEIRRERERSHALSRQRLFAVVIPERGRLVRVVYIADTIAATPRDFLEVKLPTSSRHPTRQPWANCGLSSDLRAKESWSKDLLEIGSSLSSPHVLAIHLVHLENRRRPRHRRSKGNEGEQRIWEPVHPAKERLLRSIGELQVKPNVKEFVNAEPRHPIWPKTIGL
jgi:hypothetical protein